MPELPEVETVRLGLQPVLEGRRLRRVEVRRAALRQPIPPELVQVMTGRRIAALGRRAKYLMLAIDGGPVVLVHLGMSGSMTIRAIDGHPPPGPHDHVVLDTEEGMRITFRDPRRFGLITLADGTAPETHPLLARLGPEPLDPAFTAPVLVERMGGRLSPIKAVLLDQAVVAGLGNIYVCEALFRSGLSPRRTAASISGGRAERLVAAIKAVLAEAIAAGGSSLRDHRQADGTLGYFQHGFAVYGREGEACPGCTCDPAATGGIQRLVQSGRSTFFCPRRQR